VKDTFDFGSHNAEFGCWRCQSFLAFDVKQTNVKPNMPNRQSKPKTPLNLNTGFADALKQAMKNDKTSTVISNQLLRCATSVGANYRAACRARTHSEFRSKLGIVEEECDETIYWMELIVESGIMPQNRLANLIDEANQILSIIVTSIKTSKQKS